MCMSYLFYIGDGPPFDVVQLVITKVHLDPIFLVVVVILAGMGSILALCFLLFNCVYKDKRLE